MIAYRLLGLVNAVAYALRRSKLGFVRLNVGVMVFCLLLAGYTGLRGWLAVSPAHDGAGLTVLHGSFILLCMLSVVTLIWAEASHYVLFRPGHMTEATVRSAHPVPGLSGCRGMKRGTEQQQDWGDGEQTELLPPEKKLFLRGSGLFEVSNMHRYLVEVPVVFWSTKLSEYVLAAKIRALNVLGVGVPAVERGWWYIFLEPGRVRRIVRGELYFGLRCRPAVCISYDTERAMQTVYLSSEDSQQVAIIAHDVQSKVQACRERPA